MKAATLHQPWATLAALKLKNNETRGWPTKHRGQLAIHAGLKIDYDACEREPIKSALAEHGYTADNLPTGAVLATCELVECWRIERLSDWGAETAPVRFTASDGKARKLWAGYVEGDPEYHYGNYDDGRYAWELDNVELLPEPIPAKGQQGLWNWNKPTEAGAK